MKKAAFLLGVLLLLVNCKDTVVEKPEKLIDEETMVNIIYDLSVLEAMKSRNTALVGNSTSAYVYKKYNIDSVQFVKNNQYYAAKIEKYKKIYDKVNERMENEKKIADSLAKSKGEKITPTTPTDHTPQVK